MPDHKPTVSIIVPIYNAETWLSACCESLIAQTHADWEAILMVDGSPDDSISVARSYAARDPRFRAVEIENRGIGGARNAALELARGRFNFFMDSDDELPPRALEMLLAAHARSGAEVVAGHGEDLLPGGRRKRYWTFASEQFFRRPGVYTIDEMPSLGDDHVVWAKLIDRALIDRLQLRFPEGVHCEDINFALRLMTESNRVAIVTETVYLHRRHDTQVSADYLRPKTLSDWLDQAAITLSTAAATGDERLRQHYALNHTVRQWMTRAELSTEIADPELIRGLESLAGAILHAGGSAADDLDSRPQTLLHAFADGVVSRSLQSLAGRPFSQPNAEDAAEIATAALEAIGRLDLTRDIEARLAAVLLVWQVIGPAAAGLPTRDDLLSRAATTAESLPQSAFASLTRPAMKSLRHAPVLQQRARDLQATLPTRQARVTALRASSSHVSLIGSLEYEHGFRADDRFSLVLVHPNGTVSTSPAGILRRAGGIRWQASVPLEGLQHARVMLRRTRRYAKPADLRVRIDAQAPAGITVADGDAGLLRTEAAPAAPSPRPRHQPDLYTFPDWYSNPYMTMLHTEPQGNGWSLRGDQRPDALLRELRDRRAAGIVHIHWTSPMIEKRESRAEAEAFVDELLTALRAAHDRGRLIVWTVHNALPHDSRYPDTAIRLHAGIAQIADIIHVLSDATVDAVQGVYDLPDEKVRVLQHSSYQGVYGDPMPQHDARTAIGASQDARSVLFFGQLRPYKGLDQLFDAAIALQDTAHPVELLLAGNPAPDLRGELERIQASGVAITSALRFIEDSEVAAWFSAADVAVLPYRRVLNSGATLLASTYGLPVVLPDEPALQDEYGHQPWVRFFDTADASASIAALLEDDWFTRPDARSAALGFARGRSPVAMSRAYVRMLQEGLARA